MDAPPVRIASRSHSQYRILSDVISTADTLIDIPEGEEKNLLLKESLGFHLSHRVFYKQSVIPFDDANTKASLSEHLLWFSLRFRLTRVLTSCRCVRMMMMMMMMIVGAVSL